MPNSPRRSPRSSSAGGSSSARGVDTRPTRPVPLAPASYWPHDEGSRSQTDRPREWSGRDTSPPAPTARPLEKSLGRPTMGARPLVGAHLLEHRRTDDRVRELERVLVPQEVGADERARRRQRGFGSRPASAAASDSSVRSPRIAAARSKPVASACRRARRVATPRETACGPSSSTRGACSAVGAVPSRQSASSSATRKSGDCLPSPSAARR